MKDITETIFGKEITFQRLPMMQRAAFQKKLARVVGGNFSLDGQMIPAIINAIGNADEMFLAEIAKESIAAPQPIGRDVKPAAFYTALEEWEAEGEADGLAILWALVAKSLEIQFGGIVETLGKKFGINVPNMSDILKQVNQK